MQFWRPTLFATTFAAFAGLPAEAQKSPEGMDMKLTDMGFVMRPADTPEKMARLKSQPPHKFVRRLKNGKPYYVYADPTYCKCALIGNEQAMNNYRDTIRPITPPPGYEEFAKNPGGKIDSAEHETIEDMSSDGEIGVDSDLFSFPGL